MHILLLSIVIILIDMELYIAIISGIYFAKYIFPTLPTNFLWAGKFPFLYNSWQNHIVIIVSWFIVVAIIGAPIIFTNINEIEKMVTLSIYIGSIIYIILFAWMITIYGKDKYKLPLIEKNSLLKLAIDAIIYIICSFFSAVVLIVYFVYLFNIL